MQENKTMCENLADAKANRERVADGYGNEAYRIANAILEATVLEDPLPSWMIGSLPEINNGGYNGDNNSLW